ncbi:MAG TPA: DEAD/DEAH box helicase family protein, partial [Gemmatales bacterium]|nr:DEAD/DEAH box helicase family protein [Gemmatales bacterium]
MQEQPNVLEYGSYDHVLTDAIQQLIVAAGDDTTVQLTPLDDGDSHAFLSRYLEKIISIVLEEVTSHERLQEQIKLCNKIIDQLHDGTSDEQLKIARVVASAQRLTAVLKFGRSAVSPDTPFSADCLLTGTSLDPSLLSQLRKEILTADRIDILCSFIKWGGIRVLGDELRAFASREGVSLRVITTSYMGATDLKAVEFLRALPNTRIKVSYDTQRTRLHAKAYMIHRNTNFGSAYIGSANLSEAALTDGLEWVVKISQYESPHLWEKVKGTFETYWNDSEFVTYEEAERDRLHKALQKESGTDSNDTNDGVFFDLRPHEYQREVLDAIAAEREREKHRHLVVAATGTGKTMIAAFDYRAYAALTRQQGKNAMPRLLFVVHREEILRQSLNRFRAVLRDRNFGDLIVGGREPESHDALFVSIQSYNSKQLSQRYAPDYFDYVVIDEFHRAAAPWYQELLGHIRPAELLGLTATP